MNTVIWVLLGSSIFCLSESHLNATSVCIQRDAVQIKQVGIKLVFLSTLLWDMFNQPVLHF